MHKTGERTSYIDTDAIGVSVQAQDNYWLYAEGAKALCTTNGRSVRCDLKSCNNDRPAQVIVLGSSATRVLFEPPTLFLLL